MKHREGILEGTGDDSLYYQYWLPDGDIRAVLQVVHGAGEHGGRYDRLAAYCVERGFAAVANDHPGHGRSPGVRVHVDRFNDYLAAVERVHRQLRADFPDLPVFLVGHSLGGLIASLHLLEHQAAYTGCVLSGPAIATDIEPGWLQTLIIKTLSRIYPTAGVLQLDANGVSRDPAEVRRYLDDPLVHNGKMTARMVSELFTAMGEIRASAGSITLPLLLLHGGEDAMTSPKGSRLLYHAVSSEDRELKIYPGLYHEIFNEPEHAAVFADLLSWCEARLPSVVAPVVSTPADVAPAADEDSGEQLS